jgi:uncharacterized protein (UPF0297 family)
MKQINEEVVLVLVYTSIKKKSVQVVSTILARLLSFNCCYLETCNKTRDDS